MRTVLLVVGVLLVVVSASCSTSRSSAPASGSIPTGTAAVPTKPAGNPPSSSSAPVTLPAREGASTASSVVASMRGDLPLDDAQAACLASRIASDEALLGRLAGGIDPGSSDHEQVLALAQRCVTEVVFGPAFVASLAERFPSLSEAESACLLDEFVRLPQADLEAFLGASVFPSGTGAGGSTEVLDGMLRACAVATG